MPSRGFRPRLDRCVRLVLALLGAMLAAAVPFAPALAASCYYATSQGSTGPANWQTYCWLDLSGYNDTTARTAGGQAFSYTLPDGTTMSFTLRVTGSAATSATSPSWTGAAVGNTAFLGIAGRPVLYQTAAGTTTLTFSAITLTPPAGSSGGSTYMFVAGDAESSNDGETLRFQTNGGAWSQLDQIGPISGSTYPTVSGVGTTSVTETGVAGTVGAYIFGSNSPSQVVTTLVGGGLQGTMFAVRFASIRLNSQITNARADPADQFKYDINSTSSGSTFSTATSTGTGLGPFTSAVLSASAAQPLTLVQTMASGSSSPLASYRTTLTCTNSASGSSTPLPTNVVTTNYSFGALQFGDIVQCTFTNRPFPHLQLTKALGSGGRQFNTDQFTMRVTQAGADIATTTTIGTGSTLGSATTANTMVTAGTTYAFSEIGAGATSLAQYTSAMACTNAWTGSSTVLPTTPGGAITPQMGDVIDCTITNTKRATNASLTVSKVSAVVSDPTNGATNPKFIPGAVARYTLTVANSGPSAVDLNSVVLVDSLPTTLAVGTASAPAFTQGTPTSGLTFSTTNDIRYSNSVAAPTTFAACTYTPTSAYDTAVRYVCLNPKGTMAGSTGTPPSFSVSFQAQIR